MSGCRILLLAAACWMLPAQAEQGDQPYTREQLSAEIEALERAVAEDVAAYKKLTHRVRVSTAREPWVKPYFEACRTRIQENANSRHRALFQGLQGKVRLYFEIFADGHVDNIQILESSGNKAMDAAVVRMLEVSTPCEPFPEEAKKEIEIDLLYSTQTFRVDPTPEELEAE